MERRKRVLEEFMKRHQWDDIAIASLLKCYEQWMQSKECSEILEKWVEIYKNNIHMDYTQANKDIERVANKAGINTYEGLLLLYMCLGCILPSHYHKAGLPLEICEVSLDDLKWKAIECHNVYGIWGTFVAPWFSGFFNLTRFTLGRLQYELVPFPKEIPFLEKRTSDVEVAINTHIPSSGKLDHKECIFSYKKAAVFWNKYFQVENPVFICNSWLLYPELERLLPYESNILKFQRDYLIYESSQDIKGEELWRIFAQEYDGSPERLIEKTSLQRACKRWLMDGKVLGTSKGVLKEEILHDG